MSKVMTFLLISSKVFCRPFFRNLLFFPHIQNKDPLPIVFFDFLDLTNVFLDFLDLKLFFRPKKIFLDLKKFFLDFLDLKADF